MPRLALVIALLPAVAFADALDEQLAYRQLTDTERAMIRALSLADLEHSFDLSAHASVAGTAGRLTGGQINAGGEIAWNAGVCRPLLGGGEATADRTTDGEQLSGSVWGGFCFPFPMNRFEMILRSDYALQPRLSALPVARRARYTGINVDFKNTFIGWRSETREHAVMPFKISIGEFVQPELDIVNVDVAIAAYRRSYYTGRTLEILPVEYRSAGPSRPSGMGGVYLSSHAYAFSPFRLLRTSTGSLGDYALDADFVAGLAYATITDVPAGGMQAVPILHRTYDLFTDITLRATRGEDTFALHLRRSFEPTYTDELLLDTRGDLSWYRTHGKHGVLLGVFGASTKRIDHVGPVDATPSAGARGVYNYTLPGHTQLALSAEVARSFYATLDDTVALDADWSAQVNAAFTFAWARNPTVTVATP